MNLRTITLLVQLALSPVLVAAPLSDECAAEMLDRCCVGEDGGIGYRGLSYADRYDLHDWFNQQEDPLLSINRLVANNVVRARAVVLASTVLNDRRFYQISLNALQRFADGHASNRELRAVLLPDPDKRGLLAVHYRDELLRRNLQQCLDRGIGDSGCLHLVNHILSGDGARDVRSNIGGGFPERYQPLARQALRPWTSAAMFAAAAFVIAGVAAMTVPRIRLRN